MYMLSRRVSKLFRNDVKNDYDGDRKATERQRRHYYIIIILERPPPYVHRNGFGNQQQFLSRMSSCSEGTRQKRVGTHNKTGS
jgi:hypothetical protein